MGIFGRTSIWRSPIESSPTALATRTVHRPLLCGVQRITLRSSGASDSPHHVLSDASRRPAVLSAAASSALIARVAA